MKELSGASVSVRSVKVLSGAISSERAVGCKCQCKIGHHREQFKVKELSEASFSTSRSIITRSNFK